MNLFFYLIPVFFLFSGEAAQEVKFSENETIQILDEEEICISDLQPCDILVKPNHNWLPGTACVGGGKGFGHVAIVIEGAKDTCIEELLKKTVIFESHARDVPAGYQLRKSPGYNFDGNQFTMSISFGIQHSPYRYRLRPDISEKQKREIITFILEQDADSSCWRSLKRFPTDSISASTSGDLTWEDKNQWYCSLLIWQAFYSITGIDLDTNQGLIIYPNDIISHPLFQNSETNSEKRVRF